MLETRQFAYGRKDQRSSPFCPSGQSSPSLLKLKPWIRTWSFVAAETWKKVDSELSSWCRVTGTNTADYRSNSFSDQQQKLSCRKQKQLYLTSNAVYQHVYQDSKHKQSGDQRCHLLSSSCTDFWTNQLMKQLAADTTQCCHCGSNSLLLQINILVFPFAHLDSLIAIMWQSGFHCGGHLHRGSKMQKLDIPFTAASVHKVRSRGKPAKGGRMEVSGTSTTLSLWLQSSRCSERQLSLTLQSSWTY